MALRIASLSAQPGVPKQRTTCPGCPALMPARAAAAPRLPARQKDHSTFKRIGTDLFFEKSVSLVEALCGERCPSAAAAGLTMLLWGTRCRLILPRGSPWLRRFAPVKPCVLRPLPSRTHTHLDNPTLAHKQSHEQSDTPTPTPTRQAPTST